MKVHEDCRPCLLRQMRLTARAAGAKEDLVSQVSRMVQRELDYIWDPGLSPPEISAPLYHATGKMCGKDDPYLAKKVRYTREALKCLSSIDSIVRDADDPLEMAVRISIAGNVIDFGTGEKRDDLDVAVILDDLLEERLHIDDLQSLRQVASNAGKVLFIADNAGETVFDRPLLAILKRQAGVFYAARDVPIINDATVKDAVLAGIGFHAKIVSSGSRLPGTVPGECSPEFRDLYHDADLIVAKGQGNFETLTELPREGRLFLLFVIKCPVVARHLGGDVGNMVVMRW